MEKATLLHQGQGQLLPMEDCVKQLGDTGREPQQIEEKGVSQSLKLQSTGAVTHTRMHACSLAHTMFAHRWWWMGFCAFEKACYEGI